MRKLYGNSTYASIINLIDVLISNMKYIWLCCREELQGVLTYLIPDKKIKWSSLFDTMEGAKKSFGIEHYSINRNTIGQVVLAVNGEL